MVNLHIYETINFDDLTFSTSVLSKVYVFVYFRGINFVLSALVFNVVPTVFEVSLVTGILVSYNYVLHIA